MTEQTRFEWVAGMLCRICNGPGGKGGLVQSLQAARTDSDCGGTGKRFPWLWQQCKRESTRRDCERHDEHYHGETRYLACGYCPGTGYILIDGHSEQWVGLEKVVVALKKALIITPHEWDEILPSEWIKVSDWDVEVLAAAICQALGRSQDEDQRRHDG